MGAKNTRVKKDNTASDNQKAPPRNHQYEEIDDEQLSANQEKYNEAKTGGSVEDLYDDGATAAPVKPKAIVRVHQYDEITTEDLTSNRKAAGVKKNGNGVKAKNKGKLPSNKNKEEAEVTSDSEGAEYLNVGTDVVTSSNNSFENGLYETQDEKDLYAQPMKKPKAKQLKPTSPAPLNYIEVEFNQASAQPQIKTAEVKRPRSPVNYTNVINDNGKVVLLPDS